MKDLTNIKFWLFDLDNTLYDGATKVFDQVDKKMSKFISDKLSVSLAEARKIQKNYLKHLYPWQQPEMWDPCHLIIDQKLVKYIFV